MGGLLHEFSRIRGHLPGPLFGNDVPSKTIQDYSGMALSRAPATSTGERVQTLRRPTPPSTDPAAGPGAVQRGHQHPHQVRGGEAQHQAERPDLDPLMEPFPWCGPHHTSSTDLATWVHIVTGREEVLTG